MGGVAAKALVNTLADPVAERKGGISCITLAHIKNEVLINTLTNTLVQPESDTFSETDGS